jgi:hypothetical protein
MTIHTFNEVIFSCKSSLLINVKFKKSKYAQNKMKSMSRASVLGHLSCRILLWRVMDNFSSTFFNKFVMEIYHFQTSFFTEIREIVRSDDLSQFDCLIYQKGNLLDKLLKTAGGLKVVGSFDEEDQVLFRLFL